MFGLGGASQGGRKGPRSQGQGCAGNRCPTQSPVPALSPPSHPPPPNISHLACVLGWGEVRDGGGVPRTKEVPAVGGGQKAVAPEGSPGPDHLRQVRMGRHLLLLGL